MEAKIPTWILLNKKGLNHKEGWALKNWCFQFLVVVLEKTLESPMDCKEIKLINPKGNQPWMFIRRADAEAPILRSDTKNLLFGKKPDAGKNWGQEEKEMTKNKMVGGYHQINGHGFEQTPRDGEDQGILACCSPCNRRVGHNLGTEQQLACNKIKW